MLQNAGQRNVSRREGGSAMLIVLWALILLSAAVIAWVDYLQHDINMQAEASRQLEARAMAYSGVAVALHPKVTKMTPILREEFGSALGYEVKMISEGGRLNLRWWMEGEDPRKTTILKQWMELHGLSFQERETLMDSLLDYVDADDLNRMNGVEEQGDYRAPNRPLQTVDELADVYGAEPMVDSPGWREQLTLYSQGPLDLMAAPEELLRLLPGFDEGRVQTLLNIRRGNDGIEGTEDDLEIKNVDQLLGTLGFSQPQQQSIAGLVMVNDRTMNIRSNGHSGKLVRQIEVVAVKTSGNPVIRFWKE
jgi:type II secretory pathway component PulK